MHWIKTIKLFINMSNKVRILQDIKRLKKEDYWEVLHDSKDCNEPLIIRVWVKEPQTDIEYNINYC